MDSVTFFWTILATVFAGLHIFAGKIVAHKKLNAAWNNIITYSIAAPFFFFCFWVSGGVLPALWQQIVVFAIFAGISYGISAYTRIEALKYIDTVIFFPLSKIFAPLLAVIGGIVFFSESLTLTNTIGVLLSIFVPVLLIQKSEHARQTNLRYGIILMAVSTIMATATALLAKGALTVSGGEIFFYMGAAQLAGFFTSIALLKNEERTAKERYVHSREDYVYGIISSLIGMASYVSLMNAMSTGQVSLVYTIQAHYIVIPIILSVMFYKEHMDLRKFAAVVLSMVAIGLLV